MQDTAPAESSREARYILIVESKTTDLFCDSIPLLWFESRVCAVNSAGPGRMPGEGVKTPS
jgi:hypothetical protein